MKKIVKKTKQPVVRSGNTARGSKKRLTQSELDFLKKLIDPKARFETMKRNGFRTVGFGKDLNRKTLSEMHPRTLQESYKTLDDLLIGRKKPTSEEAVKIVTSLRDKFGAEILRRKGIKP